MRVRAIEDSPIPPGYFAGICRKDGQAAKVESVSSPEKIRAYVESGSWKQADLLLWNAPDLDYVCYRFGSNLVGTVMKKGQIVHEE